MHNSDLTAGRCLLLPCRLHQELNTQEEPHQPSPGPKVGSARRDTQQSPRELSIHVDGRKPGRMHCRVDLIRRRNLKPTALASAEWDAIPL